MICFWTAHTIPGWNAPGAVGGGREAGGGAVGGRAIGDTKLSSSGAASSGAPMRAPMRLLIVGNRRCTPVAWSACVDEQQSNDQLTINRCMPPARTRLASTQHELARGKEGTTRACFLLVLFLITRFFLGIEKGIEKTHGLKLTTRPQGTQRACRLSPSRSGSSSPPPCG